MDVEKAERVEKLLDDIRSCDRILDILNGKLSNSYYGKSFALRYTSSGMFGFHTEDIPAALEGSIINLIKDHKKKLNDELNDI